jgi:hypothetical protein
MLFSLILSNLRANAPRTCNTSHLPFSREADIKMLNDRWKQYSLQSAM